jgi:hypothetical protein
MGQEVAMSRDHPSKELVRQVLRAERSARRYRPRNPATADSVRAQFAEQVIAAVAARHGPGEAVGLRQVVDAIDITWEQARAVRDWARSQGCWPWLQPAGSRPGGKSDPGPKREGGGS